VGRKGLAGVAQKRHNESGVGAPVAPGCGDCCQVDRAAAAWAVGPAFPAREMTNENNEPVSIEDTCTKTIGQTKMTRTIDSIIYVLYTDLRCLEYRYDDFENMDMSDYLNKYFSGQPLPPRWRFPKHTIGNRNAPLNDFVQGYTQAPFVSECAKAVLASTLGNEAEFVSIGKIGDRNYHVMNVLNTVDCLDHAASRILWSSDGRVLSVGSAVFRADEIPRSYIFRVPEDNVNLYVTERFVSLVRKHRITGVGFEHSNDRGLAAPRYAFADLPMRSKDFVFSKTDDNQ
jgi:hypothetical protein